MSFERTSLSGFSFTDLGGAFWPPSKATDFRFLDIFIGERRRTGVWEDGKEWKGRADRLEVMGDELVAQNVRTLSFISMDEFSVGRRVICMATPVASADTQSSSLFSSCPFCPLSVAHLTLRQRLRML